MKYITFKIKQTAWRDGKWVLISTTERKIKRRGPNE